MLSTSYDKVVQELVLTIFNNEFSRKKRASSPNRMCPAKTVLLCFGAATMTVTIGTAKKEMVSSDLPKE